MATKVMRTRQLCNNLRTAPGLHGKGIEGAAIGAYQTIVIDATIDDGWVLIVGPNPPVNPDGTYLKYGVKAWVEYAHLEELNADKSTYKIEVDWVNKTIKLI